MDFSAQKIIGISSQKDLMAVCFNSYFRVLRLNELGDIIQERKINLTNMGNNNKIVKVSVISSAIIPLIFLLFMAPFR